MDAVALAIGPPASECGRLCYGDGGSRVGPFAKDALKDMMAGYPHG